MTPSAEPAIAPLARRLAEENNVDWRTLRGSSKGGAVNERDVLDYLEAVMLGNKPLDPTPEPLPEGMTAWPEEAARPAPVSAAAPLGVTPQQPAAPPPAPARTFEAEYRAAQAELEGLRAETVRLGAENERYRSEVLELGPLRETVSRQASALTQTGTLEAQLAELREALAKASGFEKQVAGLSESLGNAQRETRKAQEHGFELAARLNKLNDLHTKAEAETKRLREANAALEQNLAKLQNRPWWRFWG